MQYKALKYEKKTKGYLVINLSKKEDTHTS